MPSESKHAVVTGGNRGLGLAIAERLVREGFRVSIVCRRDRDAQRTVEVLGPSCTAAIQLDFGRGAAAVSAAASQIKAWLGKARLDVLINNAGNSYGNWDEEGWFHSCAVNFRGPALLTEALLPVLATNASVVMVGSGLGKLEDLSPKFQRLITKASCLLDLDKLADRPIAALNVDSSWVGPYGLSKALVHRAAEIFASDDRFVSQGVSVVSVCPGWVCTDMGGHEAPISVEEGAGHILEAGWSSREAVTGSFTCFCFKNYDEEHVRAWYDKHGTGNTSEEQHDEQGQKTCGGDRRQRASKKRKHGR